MNGKFLWGSATSSFQIEGGIENDMTAWEKDGRFRQDGKNPIIGNAVDHWNRWRDDFKLLNELGLNSYRFSVEWARLEPEPGRYDQKAADQYLKMIDTLLDNNISPMLTLHHFTNPAWLHQRCPWHTPRAIEAYLRFVEYFVPRISDRVPHIITFNEPLVWLLAAYGDAKFPPGFKDYHLLMDSLYNILTAHREAYDFIKAENKDIEIGIAHNFINFKRAPKGTVVDRSIKRLIHYFYNRMIIRAFERDNLKLHFPLMIDYEKPIDLGNRIDFWGINYYYRLHVKFKLNFKKPFELLSIRRSSGIGQSDLGWEIYPKGLYKVFRWLDKTGKPLYVTENGIAVEDDEVRVQFLQSHLDIIKQAIDEGFDIRGYYYWSLLDNYEWLEGTKARFGLYHVDYNNNLERTPKPSAAYYRSYIEHSSQK